MPKPRKSHEYCGLCQEAFLDYSIHINSESHKEKFLKNNLIKEALELSFFKIQSSQKMNDNVKKCSFEQNNAMDCFFNVNNVNVNIMLNVNLEKRDWDHSKNSKNAFSIKKSSTYMNEPNEKNSKLNFIIIIYNLKDHLKRKATINIQPVQTQTTQNKIKKTSEIIIEKTNSL